jgi:phosphohistidine phosphatase
MTVRMTADHADQTDRATRTLVLIRHAKTEQAGPPDEGDHGRRLLPRGVGDAEAAGRWLAGEGLVPDLVLCSTSARTRQTWEHITTESEDLARAEVWHDPRIYNAWPEALLRVLAEVPEEVRTVAVVGHAPGVPDLVADLADAEESEESAVARFELGFPTMTCAVLETDHPWDGIPVESARLVRVHTPRREG